MFFGATPFSATTFAGVGAQNAIILAAGNRLNVSDSDITLRMWENVPTNATQTWTEIP